MFCLKPASADRILVGNGFVHICEHCVTEATYLIAAKRAQGRLHTL